MSFTGSMQVTWLAFKSMVFSRPEWPLVSRREPPDLSPPGPSRRDQCMPEAPRRWIVPLHRGEDPFQVAPRRRVAVEAVQEQHVRDQARHPVDRRRIADD